MTPAEPLTPEQRRALMVGGWTVLPVNEAADPRTPPERLAALLDEALEPEDMDRRLGDHLRALLQNPSLPVDSLIDGLCGVGNGRYRFHRVEWAWFNPTVPLLAMTRPDLFGPTGEIAREAHGALSRLTELAGGLHVEHFKGRSFAGMVDYWARYPRHGRITERNAHIRAFARRMAEVLTLPWSERP